MRIRTVCGLSFLKIKKIKIWITFIGSTIIKKNMAFIVIENDIDYLWEFAQDDPIWEEIEILILIEKENKINLNDKSLLLSKNPFERTFWEDIISLLTSIKRLEFDITIEDPKWIPIFYACLASFEHLEDLVYGRMVFRSLDQYYLSLRRETLKMLTIHCVESTYHEWMPGFLQSMKIRCLRIERFSLIWDNSRTYESSFLLENCDLSELSVRGLIPYSVFKMNPLSLRQLNLYSLPAMPYTFPECVYNDLRSLRNLVCLRLPYSDLKDTWLRIICESMPFLTTLDISGNLRLNSEGLRCLSGLKSLVFVGSIFTYHQYPPKRFELFKIFRRELYKHVQSGYHAINIPITES